MSLLILSIFFAGYAAIIFEYRLKIDKAATALLTGALCWVVFMVAGTDTQLVNHLLLEHLSDIAGILFFLLGAMTIVELIDAHNGFDIITVMIVTTSKRKLLRIICIIAFILSAVLDNLTTAIVMVSLVQKLLQDKNDRLFFSGMIVIAANAGGAWSPIGDVTTTMLWIGGQVTAFNIILKLFLPGVICLLVPLLAMNRYVKGDFQKPISNAAPIASRKEAFERNLIFFIGLFALLSVPVFKLITDLPPFVGMLIALSVVWICTEIIHRKKDPVEKDNLSVSYALRKIDTPSILFFLGILLAIGALQSTGQLAIMAGHLSGVLKTDNQLCLGIGILSAVIDNVPLVAASTGMFSLQQYPTDSYFWELLAFTTGTGGSILIIGSAAGVAAMGIEKISFIWYLKKFSGWALLGYFAGAAMYILQDYLLHFINL
jgi:Na+/H+ antiporter NhaD/arsenite permease-like protein